MTDSVSKYGAQGNPCCQGESKACNDNGVCAQWRNATENLVPKSKLHECRCLKGDIEDGHHNADCPVSKERVCTTCNRVHGKNGWTPRHIPTYRVPKFEGATPTVTNTASDESTKKSYLRDDHALQKERRQCDLITQQRDDFHAERNAERTRRFEADALIEALTYENEQLRALGGVPEPCPPCHYKTAVAELQSENMRLRNLVAMYEGQTQYER